MCERNNFVIKLFCGIETDPLEGYGTMHSVSFSYPRLGRDETGDGQNVGPKNMGEIKNPRLAPFGAK